MNRQTENLSDRIHLSVTAYTCKSAPLVNPTVFDEYPVDDEHHKWGPEKPEFSISPKKSIASISTTVSTDSDNSEETCYDVQVLSEDYTKDTDDEVDSDFFSADSKDLGTISPITKEGTYVLESIDPSGPEYDDGNPEHYTWSNKSCSATLRDQRVYVWEPSCAPVGIVFMQHGFEVHSRSTWLSHQFSSNEVISRALAKRRSDHELLNKALCEYHKYKRVPGEGPSDGNVPRHKINALPKGFIPDTFDKYSAGQHLSYRNSIVEALVNKGYMVVAMDLPDHGLSTEKLNNKIRNAFNLDDYTEQLAHLLTAVQMCKKVVVGSLPITMVGSSLGGNLLFNSTMSYGSELQKAGVNKIVLCCPMFGIDQMKSGFMKMFTPLVKMYCKWFPNTLIDVETKRDVFGSYLYRKQDPLFMSDSKFSNDYILKLIQSYDNSYTMASKAVNQRFEIVHIHNVKDEVCPVENTLDIHAMLRDRGINSKLYLINKESAFRTSDTIPKRILELSNGGEHLRVMSECRFNILKNMSSDIIPMHGVDAGHSFTFEIDGQYVYHNLLLPAIIKK